MVLSVLNTLSENMLIIIIIQHLLCAIDLVNYSEAQNLMESYVVHTGICPIKILQLHT